MTDLREARQKLLDKMSNIARTIVYIDRGDDINAFREYFSHEYNVKCFVDPIEAFYWMKQNTTDCVIANVNLNGLSGISLLRKMRLFDKLSNIPFILIADNIVPYMLDAKKIQANDLYQKPLDFEKLNSRLKYLSRIRMTVDDHFYMMQKTWTRRIYPGHFKRISSFVIAFFFFLLSLPIYIILALFYNKGLTTIERIGAGYDHVKLYNFDCPDNKFGNFLKKYNIVRWPEILNVLKGDICIIGNKALSFEEAQLYTSDKNSLRFLSPCGLTGPRHIYDVRENKSIYAAVELENRYALDRNFFQDFLIFFKAIPFLFKPGKAKYFDL